MVKHVRAQAPFFPSKWSVLILWLADNELSTPQGQQWAVGTRGAQWKDLFILRKMCSTCEYPLHGIILIILHVNRSHYLIKNQGSLLFFSCPFKKAYTPPSKSLEKLYTPPSKSLASLGAQAACQSIDTHFGILTVHDNHKLGLFCHHKLMDVPQLCIWCERHGQ